ncbi:uncharacterized protein LOC142467536 isoform X3 [Ascaphus truei]|uniref:uncharacterized protein LOC142467536 isoform X3 n=1 Tax=Ascaphus truei TaxID=8439 RepID=UPI003F594EBF
MAARTYTTILLTFALVYMADSWWPVFSALGVGFASYYIWSWKSESETGYHQETRTGQTETSAKEHHFQEQDEVDYFPNNSSVLMKALERVIGSIYSVYISPWHSAPEEMKDQPLYGEISQTIKDTFFNLRRKTAHVEDYEIISGVAKLLINHLKRFRKDKTTKKEKTHKEEIDILRKQTKVLLNHLLPVPQKDSDHIMLFLTEIVAINVLEPVINILADPGFINQSIVNKLDIPPVGTQEKFDTSTETTEDFNEPAASKSSLENDGAKPTKKKGGKPSARKAKFLRCFGVKRPDDDAPDMFRSLPACRDPADVAQSGSDEETSSEDDSLAETSLCDTLCQLWEKEGWSATVCDVQGTDNIYKIRVAKEHSLDTELWSVQRSEHDFIKIHDKLCQNNPDLELSSEDLMANRDQFSKMLKTTPHTFVKELVDRVKAHHDLEAFYFLSPLEQQEEGRHIFQNVLKILQEKERIPAFSEDSSEMREEDTSLSSSTGTSHESNDSDPSDGSGFRALKCNRTKKGGVLSHSVTGAHSASLSEKDPAASQEDSGTDTDDIFTLRKRPRKANMNANSIQSDRINTLEHDGRRRQKSRRSLLQNELAENLMYLADELLYGGNYVFRFLNKFTNKLGKEIISRHLSEIFTEEKIVSYLDNISDLIQSNEGPLPQPQPEGLPTKALELIMKELQRAGDILNRTRYWREGELGYYQ